MSWQRTQSDPITIVSDPGLDDLLALTLLDKLTPGVPKQLVSTFGNMPATVTAQNARDFVQLVGGSWSYRPGASEPSGVAIAEPWIDSRQGDNGLWNIRPSANGAQVRSSKQVASGRIISLGTFTEVARLLENKTVDDLLIMGGLFDRFAENGNPAELNVRLDPRAAEAVFKNTSVTRRVLVPAEIAFDVCWTKRQVEAIPQTTPCNRWLRQLLLAGYNCGRYKEGNELYDPLTIFLGFYPQYARWCRSGVSVETTGKQRGQTTLDSALPLCDIATAVINPQEVSTLIFRLLFQEGTL